MFEVVAAVFCDIGRQRNRIPDEEQILVASIHSVKRLAKDWVQYRDYTIVEALVEQSSEPLNCEWGFCTVQAGSDLADLYFDL